MLLDLRPAYPQVPGSDAEAWLERANIIVNKNMIPFDERKPVHTSGRSAALSRRPCAAVRRG